MSKDLYIPSTTEGKTWKLCASKDRGGFVVGKAYEGALSTTDGIEFFTFAFGLAGVGDRVWETALGTKRLTTAAKVRALKAIHDKLYFAGCIKEAVL